MKMRRWLLMMVLAALACLVWVPLWLLLSGSFMGAEELSQSLGPVLSSRDGMAVWPLLPMYPTLQPYVELLLDTPAFFAMFWNSCLQVFPLVAGQILIGAPAAWAFARFQFRGKKLLYSLYIVLMLMPFQVTMLSKYLVLQDAGLINTRWAVILPAIFSTFPVFLIYRSFAAIPAELLEAARVDGAGEWQSFVRVGMPVAQGGILAAMILSFLESWNMMEEPLTFLQDKSLWPLSLYLPEIAMDQAGYACAASVITLTVSLFVFAIFHDALEQGIVTSGLKA